MQGIETTPYLVQLVAWQIGCCRCQPKKACLYRQVKHQFNHARLWCSHGQTDEKPQMHTPSQYQLSFMFGPSAYQLLSFAITNFKPRAASRTLVSI